MARWTEMVDAKPDPAPLRGGVEVHMLTYEPVDRLSIGEGGDGWAGLPSATMLINFADEAADLAVAQPGLQVQAQCLSDLSHRDSFGWHQFGPQKR